jgi:drug/metabolite transporter (DMT)-like permease
MAERAPRIPSVHLALIAVQVMFASLAIVAKLVLRHMPPFGLIAFRAPMAALVLLALRALQPWEKVAPRDLPTLAVYGFFGITANQLLFIAGLERSTATNAVVIGASIPVFTAGIAVFTRRESATAGKLLGLAVALTGALAIIGMDRFDSGGHALGNLLLLGNSLAFSIYLVISRDLLARYRPITVICWTMAFGALGVIPVGVIDLACWAAMIKPTTWLEMVYIVLFPTVGTYFLNSYALKRAPSSLVAVYVYVQPVIGAVMAAWALGERPTLPIFIGGPLIALGIWLVTRSALKAAPAPSA